MGLTSSARYFTRESGPLHLRRRPRRGGFASRRNEKEDADARRTRAKKGLAIRPADLRLG